MARVPVNQPYQITTEFGVPDSNALFGRHSGLDLGGFSQGRPIYAPASGQLTNVVSNTGGNMVVIFDGQYYHRLMHNSSFSRGNGRVSEGEEVAKAGTTGLSTGVHCHWDINNQGTYPNSFSSFINPNVWLNNGGGNMSRDNIDQNELDKISKAYTGSVASAVPAFQNNLGNPLSTALDNFEGYSETRNWRLRAEGYTDLEKRIKQLEKSEQDLAQAVVDRDKRIEALEKQGSGGYKPLGKEVFIKE